jgi:hypothetical protein
VDEERIFISLYVTNIFLQLFWTIYDYFMVN